MSDGPPTLNQREERLAGLYLQLDDDQIPIEGDLTLGRHLDNDVIVPGEDVLDYHLRLELSPRGLIAHPLLDATVQLNGETMSEPRGLAPGDRLELGSTPTAIGRAERHEQGPPGTSAQGWQLIPISAPEPGLTLNDRPQLVGRTHEAALKIEDDHVSRQHAELWVDGYVWLRDLGSANGTSINGQRVSGVIRLFHGDYIGFDNHRYQLVGSGGDLTPVLPPAEALPLPFDNSEVSAPPRNDTTEIGIVDVHADLAAPSVSSAIAKASANAAGAFLVGASEPVNGLVFRPPVGRAVVGRGPSSDLVIADQTVSLQHAELMTRAEGCTVNNLMATNGTWVNGASVQTQLLADGDILRLGRVTLVYKDQPLRPSEQRLLNRIQLALLVGSLIVAGALVYAWL